MKMILGEGEGSEYMADASDGIQYGNEECYGDLPYEPRQIRGGDPNNNHIGQPNRNQPNNQHQHSTVQFNNQPSSHLNLVNQFVDQFSNFNCNSLMPSLSSQQQQQQQQQQQHSQNVANNSQQLFVSCSNLSQLDQCKEASLSNLINQNLSNGQIKIKTENAIDLSSSTNLPTNISSCASNSSSNLTNLPNLSNLSNSANMSIPLITNPMNLNSINCDKANQKVMLVNHNASIAEGLPSVSLPNNAHSLPISLANNLPVNFNEFLLNDYQSGQLNLVNAQTANEPNKCHPNSLEQSNKINSNNELSPIDMEDQERIKLERKRMRNR